MTTLQITPNWKNKTAKFKGTIAAGEHVAVSIADEDGHIADTTNLRLRVVNPMNGKTLAQFPIPEPADEETDGEDEVLPSAEAPADGEVEWISGDGQVSCIIDLNTVQMLTAVPPAANVPLLFVLDAYRGTEADGETGEITEPGEFTLYFKDMCEVTHWPRRRGEEEPTNLDDYKDLIEDFRERIDAAEDSIRDAVDEANGIVAHVDAAKTDAQNSATAAGNSASAAQTSAATAKNWATGGGETGDPGAENNAKYYAQQAKGFRNTAEEHKDAAAISATSAANSATAAEQWATGGTGGTPSATNNAKYYAEQAAQVLEDKADKDDLDAEVERATAAEQDLDDAKADKSTTYSKTEVDNKISNEAQTRADQDTALGGQISNLASTKANKSEITGFFDDVSYDSANHQILFKQGSTVKKTLDAAPFIKDGMVSSVAIDTTTKELVITFNSDSGQTPIRIPLADIFDPDDYLTADETRAYADNAAEEIMTNIAAEGIKGNPRFGVPETHSLGVYSDGQRVIEDVATFDRSKFPATLNGASLVEFYGGTHFTATIGSPAARPSGYEYLRVFDAPWLATVCGQCFYQCYRLERLHIPRAASVGRSSFAKAASLAGSLLSMELPSLQTIGSQYAFTQFRARFVSLPSLKTVTRLHQFQKDSTDTLVALNMPSLTSIEGAPGDTTSLLYQCNWVRVVSFGNSLSAVPELNGNKLFDTYGNIVRHIVVPDALYDDWINATGWSTMAADTAYYAFHKYSENHVSVSAVGVDGNVVSGLVDGGGSVAVLADNAVNTVTIDALASGVLPVVFPDKRTGASRSFTLRVVKGAGASSVAKSAFVFPGVTINNSSDIPELTGAETVMRFDEVAENTFTVSQPVEFTPAEKEKLAGVEAGAEENVVETVKVNGTALVPDGSKAINVVVPTQAGDIGAATTAQGAKADSALQAGDIDATLSSISKPADAKAVGDALRVLNPRAGVPDTHTLAILADGTRVVGDISAFTQSTFSSSGRGNIVAIYGGTHLTSLSNYPHVGLSKIETMVLPSATSIPASAFYLLSTLRHVELQSLTSISGTPFQGCTALESVYLPAVTSIGSLFRNCTSLKLVNLGPGERDITIAPDCFDNKSVSCIVVVPDGKYSALRNAAWNGEFRLMAYSTWRSTLDYDAKDWTNGAPVYTGRSIFEYNPVNEMTPKVLAANKRRATGGKAVGATPLVIAHFSDIHGSAANLWRYLDFCRIYSEYIDVMLNTGDTLVNNIADKLIYYKDEAAEVKVVEPGAERILTVIGNHDTRGSATTGPESAWSYASAAETRARFIDPFVNDWGAQIPDGVCYYYKDFARPGKDSTGAATSTTVRLIAIDVMHFDEDQLTWLTARLGEALSGGYHVVIAAHFVIEFSPLPCSYNPSWYTWTACGYKDSSYNFISGAANVARFEGAFDAVKTFMDAGGNFACWLVGHQHFGYVSRIDNTARYGNQLVVGVDTARGLADGYHTNYMSLTADPVLGTKNGDAFALVSIDPTMKKILVQKVGRLEDCFGTRADAFCAYYDPAKWGIYEDNGMRAKAGKEEVAQVAADLRYRIAEAGYATTGARLPDNVTMTDGGSSVSMDVVDIIPIAGDRYRLRVNGETRYVFWYSDGSLETSDEEDIIFYVNNVAMEQYDAPNLIFPRALFDRTVNLIAADSGTESIDIEIPDEVYEPTGVRRARDFLVDVDNSANASDLALEFVHIGSGGAHGFAFVADSDDSIGEMTTIGAGERVRLYLTETSYYASGGSSLPVIQVARVTLGDFVTSTTPAQGGN